MTKVNRFFRGFLDLIHCVRRSISLCDEILSSYNRCCFQLQAPLWNWSRRIKCYLILSQFFFFLERDRENVGYNFSYLNSPLIICFFSHINPFMVVGIHTRALLIIWAKEISTCSLVYIGPIVQEKLDHCWILIHNGYVQNAFPCVKKKTTPM